MKRFPIIVCLAFLLVLSIAGTASTASQENTTTVTTTARPTDTPELTGGSIFFETYPPGAAIWLDNTELGTSPFTYFSRKTGTLGVIIRKKGYEDYTGTVTVNEGKRVVFTADLKEVSHDLPVDTPPAEPVTTPTTFRKSTITVPTPWPTSPESPGDPAIVIVAVALGTGLVMIRRP
jgi:eukaryotic-like serine/threonine-protein kinase